MQDPLEVSRELFIIFFNTTKKYRDLFHTRVDLAANLFLIYETQIFHEEFCFKAALERVESKWQSSLWCVGGPSQVSLGNYWSGEPNAFLDPFVNAGSVWRFVSQSPRHAWEISSRGIWYVWFWFSLGFSWLPVTSAPILQETGTRNGKIFSRL